MTISPRHLRASRFLATGLAVLLSLVALPAIASPASATASTDGDLSLTIVTQANNDVFEVPIQGAVTGTVNIQWGDGSASQVTTPGNKPHTYSLAGTYHLTVTGTFTQFGNTANGYRGSNLLASVQAWGNNGNTSFNGAFANATSLTSLPSELPATTRVTDFGFMFYGASNFDQSLNSWNTSSVTNMARMFDSARSFNGDISNWNTSNVTDMYCMFGMDQAFNQDISKWNTSKVTNMSLMFFAAAKFNQNIGGWNTSNVTDMSRMFDNVTAFNANISSWDTSKVTNMYGMFAVDQAFNQDIGSWNTANVTNMSLMFASASSFNQNIGGWNTSKVTDMSRMFDWATSFNANITSWDTSKVTDMYAMFNSAGNFDRGLGNWVIGNVTNMARLLTGTSVSVSNYSTTLQGWSSRERRSNLTLDAPNSWYDSTATSSRNSLLNNSQWTINDRGLLLLPEAPRVLVAEPADSSASIAFTAGSNGGAAISKYQYSTDGGTTWADTAAGTTSPVTINALTNGSSYSIKLRAVNTFGSSAGSTAVVVTPRTTPSAPTSLYATPGNTSVSIAFTAGAGGGAAITKYQYQVDSGSWLAAVETSSPIRINGLTNGTNYSIKLRAVNSVGDGAASDATSATPSSTSPAAPTSLIATPGGGSASIAFTAGSNGGAAITKYQYSTDGGTNWVDTDAGTTSPVKISGLTNGTSYSIKLRAVNDIGAGPASSAVSVTPHALPTVSTGSSPLPRQVLVTWAELTPTTGRVLWYRAFIINPADGTKLASCKTSKTSRSCTAAKKAIVPGSIVQISLKAVLGLGGGNHTPLISTPKTVTTHN